MNPTCQYQAWLDELLALIMDEDAAYVEGGAKLLDDTAWKIAREHPNLPERLRCYVGAAK